MGLGRCEPLDGRWEWGASYPLGDEEEPHKTGVHKSVEPGGGGRRYFRLFVSFRIV